MVYTVILQRKTKLTEIEKYNTSKETMFTISDIKINQHGHLKGSIIFEIITWVLEKKDEVLLEKF